VRTSPLLLLPHLALAAGERARRNPADKRRPSPIFRD